MQKLDHADDNSEKLKEEKIPEEQKKFIKESKSAKVVPINEDLERTLNQSSLSSSKSNRLSNIKSKLLSFKSERMTTEFNSRYSFIRNVFLLLFLQSVSSIIFAVVVLKSEKIRKAITKTKIFIIITSTILSFLVILILCYRRLFKIKKLEWILFILFTISKSLVAAYISEISSNLYTIASNIILCGICISIVIYSIYSKENFENRMALLITLLSCTIFFGISFVIMQTYVENMFYIYICVLIFGFFIVYDVQLIAGGRFQDFTYDDYVPTSLIVFIEIIGVLSYILKLFRESI
ncbi:hypothetical protein SteCoe_36467 [Stentor coeruleus]|uniref:Inhibitor of apoptosis-promoting Bax1 protein n=1 Tax=Stentor coeruleus TaxID=5963 RepID=A0A1R2AQ36_9CILI|nr:hypothetical protein SteCoe_36467 [Stentor coeruleus]